MIGLVAQEFLPFFATEVSIGYRAGLLDPGLGIDIPGDKGAIVAPADQSLAVRTEGDAGYCLLMPLQGRGISAVRGQVPEHDLLIPTAARQYVAVGAESEAGYLAAAAVSTTPLGRCAATSQDRILASRLPLASKRPSGLGAKAVTAQVCPFKIDDTSSVP